MLMENAAVRIAEFAAGALAALANKSVLVCCGPGNNGGDGLAVARHLVNGGFRTAVVIGAARHRYGGDAAVNLGIVEKMRIEVLDGSEDPRGAMGSAVTALGGAAGLIVDALLGTGVERAPRGPVGELIERVNGLRAAGWKVLSVDIPSGLDADTGLPAGGIAVRADWTVTLVGLKAGFLNERAREFVGELTVGDIGVPRVLAERLGRRSGVR